ncbi:MAG: hypothetical protein ACYC8T_05940 [Myxococcaceae bacterium]
MYLPVKAGGVGTLGVEIVERAGLEVKVTSRERTLVDVLDRLELGPRPAELWRCFREAGALDRDLMIRHANDLGNRLAAARLGFFLENLPGTSPSQVRSLECLRPNSPGYFDRKKHTKGGTFVPRWNLVVPRALLKLVEG